MLVAVAESALYASPSPSRLEGLTGKPFLWSRRRGSHRRPSDGQGRFPTFMGACDEISNIRHGLRAVAEVGRAGAASRRRRPLRGFRRGLCCARPRPLRAPPRPRADRSQRTAVGRSGPGSVAADHGGSHGQALPPTESGVSTATPGTSSRSRAAIAASSVRRYGFVARSSPIVDGSVHPPVARTAASRS